jgi:hypothetical protein
MNTALIDNPLEHRKHRVADRTPRIDVGELCPEAIQRGGLFAFRCEVNGIIRPSTPRVYYDGALSDALWQQP